MAKKIGPLKMREDTDDARGDYDDKEGTMDHEEIKVVAMAREEFQHTREDLRRKKEASKDAKCEGKSYPNAMQA